MVAAMGLVAQAVAVDDPGVGIADQAIERRHVNACEVGIGAEERRKAVATDARDEGPARAAGGIVDNSGVRDFLRHGESRHHFGEAFRGEELTGVMVGHGLFLVHSPQVVGGFVLHGFHPFAECAGEMVGGMILIADGGLSGAIAAHDLHVGFVIPQKGVDAECQPVLETPEKMLVWYFVEMRGDACGGG